jgi:hypothetical protein
MCDRVKFADLPQVGCLSLQGFRVRHARVIPEIFTAATMKIGFF